MVDTRPFRAAGTVTSNCPLLFTEVAKAARWLGVTRTTMREKLTHFGLRPAGEKPEGT
jgi:hypothetical protein